MFHMTRVVTREKISATVDKDVLARARALTGLSSISELLDRALAAAVEAALEARWHAGYESQPATSSTDPINASYPDLGLGG
jgi:post-segregation antitoxin (ccd killing protein)